jgi:DNA-binding NarL/FixJ family response regulator
VAVTGRPNASLCRVGLRGETAFVERARRILDGAGIEICPFYGGNARENGSARRELDALVTSVPGGTASVSADLPRLRAGVRSVPIVVVVDSIDRGNARAMVGAGVRGVVLGQQLEAALAPTVRAVLAGQVAIPRSARHQIFRPVLSPRESTVLAMVAVGHTNAEIAARLRLEESTIKSHLRSLFAKLGVRSREDAAATALDRDGQVSAGVMAVTEQREGVASS